MPSSPPASTLDWVLREAEADELVAVEPLRGGWTSAIHSITVRARGRDVRLVLRRMVREPWRSHAEAMLEREAAVMQLLAGSPVRAPELVALDAHARETDEPALLMTHLPGRLRLRDPDVPALARTLAAIHRIVPAERPRPYESWAPPEKRVVPAWAADPGVWHAAFSALERDPPPFDGCFLHRDFHPGNVLCDATGASGVVDWVETSWGPAALDVAHCATALALLEGPGAADALHEAYGTASGAPAADDGYWALLDAVGYLPDPDKVAGPWRVCGRADLTPERARRRLEAHVAAILA